ncbi:MAG: 6-phospho-beta-glucosidase [Chloroflexota bacterium]
MMKLTLIGGGGVRAPLFVAATLRRAQLIGLTELCLMDLDEEKLHLIGPICRYLARTVDGAVRITTTTDPRLALAGARYVVTTIRVGGDMGRILDERIALQHGVLGQETTGPGGFAMAMRSIPAILDYAGLLEQVSPDAWLFNFTNPAGLVTQALRDSGFSRTIGICDGANVAQHGLAAWLKVKPRQLRAEVFGLNHLSWTRRVLLNGEDVLSTFLSKPEAMAGTMMRIFDPELVHMLGMWLNEYLYYYYYSEQAVKSIQSDDKTRGEEILELNHRLVEQLRSIDLEQNPQAALEAYYATQRRRNATYMHYARPDAPTMAEADRAVTAMTEPAFAGSEADEGYAGVALDIIEAFETGDPLYIALNVPNEGAISCMQAADVVEVSCVVDRNGVRPLPMGAIPEHQELLMRAVKQYERLAVEAILNRSRSTAVLALMNHPLVLSYSRATALVEAYLAAHRAYIGNWR